MSLTVMVKSRRWRWRFSLNRRQLVAAVAVTLGLGFIAGRAVQSPENHLDRVNYATSGLEREQARVASLKQQTQQQLNGMLLKLGDMQSQLYRLNALGERLTAQADINADEFNFQSRPATGGPATDTLDVDLMASQPDLMAQIETVSRSLGNKHRQLRTLENVLRDHHIDAQTFLAGRPIQSGWLSSYYGTRKDPFTGMPAMHKGLDFAGKEGTEVVATGAGIVTWSGERYGYGNLVEIEHGNGLVTRYGHNKDLLVEAGDVVTQGQPIAEMGNTGRSTGAHVHYEVIRDGRQIDPLPFVYRESQVR